jgi:hypothetical protein
MIAKLCVFVIVIAFTVAVWKNKLLSPHYLFVKGWMNFSVMTSSQVSQITLILVPLTNSIGSNFGGEKKQLFWHDVVAGTVTLFKTNQWQKAFVLYYHIHFSGTEGWILVLLTKLTKKIKYKSEKMYQQFFST